MELQVTNYGATIISLKVPDKNNHLVNVVAGLNSAESYTQGNYKDAVLCLGACIGRYAGRISNGFFSLEDHHYELFHIDGVHLHGGEEGFDKKIWNITEVNEGPEPSVTLSRCSKDGEEGYPGNLQVSVTYALLNNNSLKISHSATTDKATPVNLTNHSYFNLNGGGSVLEHSLKISSSKHLEVDDLLRPTGTINNSIGTKFDRNTLEKINRSDFDGFDDTFILDNDEQSVATLASKQTGIIMEVFTNQPSIVVYTPKQFPQLDSLGTEWLSEYPAICFETQNYPDAPNHKHFPSSWLKPGETYSNETLFKFSSES